MQNKNKANNISVAGKKTTFIMERTNNTRNIAPTIKDIISSTFFNLSASTNLYFSSFFFFVFDVFSSFFIFLSPFLFLINL
jgi:UDP-N-acetylglucosamine pyrophosphorylase